MNRSIKQFLDTSLTAYHATSNIKEMLLNAGFIELNEMEQWKLSVNERYFVTKNSSAIIAFAFGDIEENYAFNIAACHTDSPSFKVKGDELISSQEGKRINVEMYGGTLNYSFMNIPLKIAGRVFVKDNDNLEQRIITSSYSVNIPSLSVHQSNTPNDGVELKVQSDMLPLVGHIDDLYKTLVTDSDIIDADLYCVPCAECTYTGIDNEFITSPRIDNLTSAYSMVKAMIRAKTSGVSILFAADNEEVGSLTKQGAQSSFLPNVLKRINKALDKTEEDYYIALSKGFFLSVDNAHAVHPAHPEKNDPVNNVVMNGGVVIKHHPHYSTDGLSASVIKTIASNNGIPTQDYYQHSDVRAGSTIGLMASTQLEMNACDIGIAQLAMHSAIETAGSKDVESMENLLTCFYETMIFYDKDKIIIKDNK